jgi:hypothetical protein
MIDIHVFVPDEYEAGQSSLALSKVNFQKIG